MTMVSVRTGLMDDANTLAPKLRTPDRREILAATGEEPLAALKRSIAWSDPCYALVDELGIVIALFGVVPDNVNRDIGSVWLLGSYELVNHSIQFVKHCRNWVDILQEDYRVIWNYVDARNEVHIKWLKWCGFTFLRLVDNYGVEQRPFYEFEKVRGE
jgi:hypothetical protein